MQDRVRKLEEILARAYHVIPENALTAALLDEIEEVLQQKTERERAAAQQVAS